MAGTLKIGGNVIATHAGSEGAGTVTLDSSTLTIGSNTTIQGAMNAGSLTSGVTFPDGHVIQMKYKRHYVEDHHHMSSGDWTSHGDEANFKFTFTPQSATSTILLEFFAPVTHTSSSGGWGYFAFTHDGDRDGFGGGLSGYVDSAGHWRSGFSTYSGMYHATYGKLAYQNNSTTAFELGMDVKWAHNNWYYAHSGGFCLLQATEFAGNCSG
jgi:hypothetical protein